MDTEPIAPPSRPTAVLIAVVPVIIAVTVSVALLGGAPAGGAGAAVASPTRGSSEAPEAMPAATASSRNIPSLAGTRWFLDWRASGIDPTVRSQIGKIMGRLAASFRFGRDDVVVSMGMGGGCQVMKGPYAQVGAGLTIEAGVLPGDCGFDGQDLEVARRLAGVASIDGTTARMSLLDADGQTLLVVLPDPPT